MRAWAVVMPAAAAPAQAARFGKILRRTGTITASLPREVKIEAVAVGVPSARVVVLLKILQIPAVLIEKNAVWIHCRVEECRKA